MSKIPKWNGIIVTESYFHYLVRTMWTEIEAYLAERTHCD